MSNKIDIFLEKLHEEQFFDIDLFLEILENTLLVRSDKKAVCKILQMLLYIQKSFIYHFDQNDQSQLINFSQLEEVYTDILFLTDSFINILFGCECMDSTLFAKLKQGILSSITNPPNA
jgi:hypothetical protein